MNCRDFVLKFCTIALALTLLSIFNLAHGHHSVGDFQSENPHNPNNYTFTFADLDHCSEKIVALVDGNLELCKELGWSDDSGEWDNPYLHKEGKIK